MSTNLKQIILLTGDILTLYLALFLALVLRFQTNPMPVLWNNHWPIFTMLFFVWLVIFYLSGLYDLRQAKNNLSFFGNFFTGIGINLLLSIGFFYLLNLKQLSPKTILLIFVGLYAIIFILWRLMAHFLLKSSNFRNKIAFLGVSEEAKELIGTFKNNPQIGYETVAVFLENPPVKDLPAKIEIKTDTTELLNYIKQKGIDTVILVSENLKKQTDKTLYELILAGVAVAGIDTFFENITHRVPISALSENWFLENLKDGKRNGYNIIKRWIDVVLAIIMTVIFLAVLPFIAVIIYLDGRGPIFYRQKRIGQDGKIFAILKFRSMTPDAEQNGPQFTATGDKRITRVGKILRILRLDELPQAINILKNEMSFIGPRPERPEFVNEIQKMTPYYNARHLVKPGLTGWAQVNHSYTDSFEGNLIKLQFDLFYIKNRSLFLDALTLLKTVNAIVKRTGR